VSLPRQALVLTAGLGTRLRPLTLVRAKPAIPVAGEPIARRIIRWLAAEGVADLVLNLHHLPETLAAVIGDGSDLDVRVRYSWEGPLVLGSAGGPRHALSIIGAETFFVVNGDTLTDLRLAGLAEAHAQTDAMVTLALVPNLEPERYGGVLLDAGRRVTGFAPRGAEARGSFHFIGVQAVHRDAFAALPDKTPINSIGGAYDELIGKRPGSIRGYVCAASFFDIGTVADYWSTSKALAAAPFDSIIWDNVTVPAGTVVDECIVTDGVTLEAGTVYRRAIVMRGADGRAIAEPLNLSPAARRS
jgi:NDP-sugar pyrophosphorylase family protein